MEKAVGIVARAVVLLGVVYVVFYGLSIYSIVWLRNELHIEPQNLTVVTVNGTKYVTLDSLANLMVNAGVIAVLVNICILIKRIRLSQVIWGSNITCFKLLWLLAYDLAMFVVSLIPIAIVVFLAPQYSLSLPSLIQLSALEYIVSLVGNTYYAEAIATSIIILYLIIHDSSTNKK